MAGVPLATVSTLLGHKSLSMTMRSAHLPPKHMLSGVRVLDRQKSRSLDNHLAVSGLEGRDKVQAPASPGTYNVAQVTDESEKEQMVPKPGFEPGHP